MSTYEMSKEERKEKALVTALDTIEALGSFVADVALNPKEATPESVAALPEVAEAISSLFCVVTEELL